MMRWTLINLLGHTISKTIVVYSEIYIDYITWMNVIDKSCVGTLVIPLLFVYNLAIIKVF